MHKPRHVVRLGKWNVQDKERFINALLNLFKRKQMFVIFVLMMDNELFYPVYARLLGGECFCNMLAMKY